MKEAKRRLIYEELFLLQLSFAFSWSRRKKKGISFKCFWPPYLKNFLRIFPSTY